MKYILAAILLFNAVAFAEPAKPDIDGWRARRFGMFIHWGPVSLTGHEISWSRGDQTPIEKYDNLYKEFNPVKFNADDWVAAAKAAGMKYIVLTTKHHDGFCLWNTQQTDYNIMNSPFGRDVVKELSAACKKAGIAFGTYYSTCDWHHPNFPGGGKHGSVKNPDADLDRYTTYLTNQVAELINNYGPLCTIWFDVPQHFDAKRGQAVIDTLRSLQPDIVINNRVGARGDYDTPEQTIGGFNTTRPWETCMTICNQWSWKPNDGMKSLVQCLQTLILTTGGDGNLLFNVGPMPTGEIEPRQVQRLKEMGEWLAKYGETVYATRGGPYKPGSWGASTHKDNTVYVHILNFPANGILTLPALDKKIIASKLLTGGSVDVQQTDEAVTITIPVGYRQEADTLVELTLDGPASEIKTATGHATASNTFQNNDEYGPDMAVDGNPDTRWATDAGTQSAWIEIELPAAKKVSTTTIVQEAAYANRIEAYEFQAEHHGEWKTLFTGEKTGTKEVLKFDPITAKKFRLNITKASDGPTINEIEIK